MRASDRGVETSTDTGEPVEARLVDVLLEGGEVAFGVRLRIAIDVLEQAANMGAELLPRAREGGLRLEHVLVGGDGVARHVGEGTWGAAEIVWEILAGRALQGSAVPLRRIADDVTEPVESLVMRMLARDRSLPDLEGIVSELEDAGRGHLDTHEDVRHAMGVDRAPVDDEVAVSVAPASISRVLEAKARRAAAADVDATPTGAESSKNDDAPLSASARDPQEAGLLEEVDEAWPSSASSRPPPPGRAAAPLPSALRIVKLPTDDADLEETRLRPPSIERLRDSDADDRLTPDEPTLLRPRSWDLRRHVVRAEPVPRSVTEALETPLPAAVPSLSRAGYEPIPVIDEDSDDGTGQEEAETHLYRARLHPGARKGKPAQPASAATTETKPTAEQAEARASSPTPQPEEPADAQDESIRPPPKSSSTRAVLVALLIGSILAVVAFEVWKQTAAPAPRAPSREAPQRR
jgi:hypothetical protein